MTDRIRIVEAPAIMKVPPPRATFYGQPKIGKTTFASLWPNPVFVQTEDGAAGLAVAKIPETPCQSWDELMDCLRFIVKDPQDRKTVVIDTLDRAEALAQKKVKLEHFDDDDGKFMSYHKGPAIAGKMIAELLYALDVIRKTHDMNIVLLAHDGLAPGANALGEDFKKWAPSLSKQAWGIVRDWSDQIGHLQSAFRVKEGKARELGNERTIQFLGSPARDAGCRAGYEMPDNITLSYDAYKEHMGERIYE